VTTDQFAYLKESDAHLDGDRVRRIERRQGGRFIVGHQVSKEPELVFRACFWRVVEPRRRPFDLITSIVNVADVTT